MPPPSVRPTNRSAASRFAALSLIAAATLGLTTAARPADTSVWQPSSGHRQIALWTDQVPDAQPAAGAEAMTLETGHLVAGKPWVSVSNVTQPTLTVYSPTGHNTGIAVVVFPGGGYHELAIDLEGTEVCEWLNARGITGILLKYRVPDSGHHWDPKLRRHVEPKVYTALQDAQRALGIVRQHAAEWHLDPRRIGVLGFSAGGHLAAAISTHYETRIYPKTDAADDQSCRPDFAVALYPGHLWSWTPGDNPNFDLNPDIARHVTRQTPPTFLLQAQDDQVDSVNDALVYYIALKNAGAPTELHLYPHGGHAFGLRPTSEPITHWPDLMLSWLNRLFP